MIVFPAVDIKDGKAVRLAQGCADKTTIFSNDPVAMATHWQEQGAKYLHIVDLDGAFEGTGVNFSLVTKIRKALTIPLQIGGGIRDLATARAYINAGADRCIIGTMALESPDGYAELCAALPGKIGVSLDAGNGRLDSPGSVTANNNRNRNGAGNIFEFLPVIKTAFNTAGDRCAYYIQDILVGNINIGYCGGKLIP